MKTFVSSDLDALFELAAEHISRRIAEAIENRGRCTLFLSGGKTPIPLFERLAQVPLVRSIPWESVWIGWADERCVPPSDEASNYASAKRALLQHLTIPDKQICRIPGELPPGDAAYAYEIRLRELLGDDGRPDVIQLGMGIDGHTASLFPEHPALEEAERWVLPVHVNATPAWRVTLTLPFINRARAIVCLATGREKSEAFRRYRQGENLPIADISPQEGEMIWFLDRATAGN